MHPQKNSARSISAAEKKEKAIRLRLGGLSFAEIGRQLGVSRTMAFKYINSELKELAAKATHSAEQLRQMELLRLDKLTTSLWLKAAGGDVYAIDRVLKIMERRAKLTGIDGPQKVAPVMPGGDDPYQNMSTEDLNAAIDSILDQAGFTKEP